MIKRRERGRNTPGHARLSQQHQGVLAASRLPNSKSRSQTLLPALLLRLILVFTVMTFVVSAYKASARRQLLPLVTLQSSERILETVIGFEQGPERVVDTLPWRNEPIKIVKLKTKGKAIGSGKKFAEEDDWLKGLTVTVENVSNKAISRIELGLSFPRPEGPSETIPTFSEKMIYGRDPSDADYEVQKQVLPGESVDVKLLEVNLPFIKTALEDLGYPEKITRAQIMVETVTFIDGTMWAGGDTILYPDPTNPRQKINPKFPLPEKFKRRPNQSALPCKSPVPRFLNASFLRTKATGTLKNHSKVPFGKFWLLQDSTLPCNTVFVTTQTFECGDSGSGCTFKKNVFDDDIELLGIRNARKTLESVRCKRRRHELHNYSY